MSSENEWAPSVRRVSTDVRNRLQYVASLMREERFDDAHHELLVMLDEDNKSPQARMMLGAVYLRQEKHADALDQFKQVIEIEPMQAQAHVWAGMCSLRLSDVDQASAYFQTALDLDPKQIRANFGMAQVLAQTGRPQEAMVCLNEALDLDPQMAPARMLRARLLSESGNVDAAIQDLSAFLDANPDHTGASVRLAMAQRSQGNSGKSVELLEGVLESNPESNRLWELLGRLKTSAKDHEGAERAFRKVIELDPQDRSAPLRLADALIKQGKFDEAREVLQTVPRRGRLTSLVHRAYGDLYLARQLYNDAVQSYRASILNTPDGERILAEIEAAAGPDASSESMIPHFQAIFEKLREQRREQGRKGERGGAAGRRRQSGGSRAGSGDFAAETRVLALE